MERQFPVIGGVVTGPGARALEIACLQCGEILRGRRKANAQVHHAGPVGRLRVLAPFIVRPAKPSRFNRHPQRAQPPKKISRSSRRLPTKESAWRNSATAPGRSVPLGVVAFGNAEHRTTCIGIPIHHRADIRQVEIKLPRPPPVAVVASGEGPVLEEFQFVIQIQPEQRAGPAFAQPPERFVG